jgi:hypothetical protein
VEQFVSGMFQGGEETELNYSGWANQHAMRREGLALLNVRRRGRHFRDEIEMTWGTKVVWARQSVSSSRYCITINLPLLPLPGYSATCR